MNANNTVKPKNTLKLQYLGCFDVSEFKLHFHDNGYFTLSQKKDIDLL